MVTNMGVTEESEIRYYAGIGQGISRSMADDIRMKIALMPTLPFYQ